MAGTSRDWPVHQLWPPSESKERTELNVIFFHGLNLTANDSSDAWSSTWTQRGHDVCWPQEWLPSDLGKAVRIFSVSYNADVENCPYDHVSDIAHNLFQNLMDRRYEWNHPIVLIGHSFGGLVLKSLVVQLKRESTIRHATNSLSEARVLSAKVFLRNVRGVAFYAVPHTGASNIAKYLNKVLRCNNRRRSGIMDNIRPQQRDMEHLSEDFDDIVQENKINIYAFCEGRPMEQMGILVKFASAQRLSRTHSYMVEDANHMEVCQPPFKKHPSYELLLQLINVCQEVSKECDQALQEDHDLPHAMFGLESHVEKVETLLTSNDADPQYVGVRGMGGVGKTLLLQRVYASPTVHGHFKGAKFIWLTVGRTTDIMALYRTLSAELGLPEEKTPNAGDYKSKLLPQFKQKRVFLVLDDVWEDKTFDSLNLAKGKGSATLLSTRNLSLLEKANPEISQVYITPLSKKDSWNLFCVHAFRPPSNVPCELKALAHSMAEECKGLPLALKVVGRAMFKKNLRQWEPLLKKLRESRMSEKSVEEELYERLKVGYDLLSEDDCRLKQCFHYFAAFPEDTEIVFEEILCHWIGEGLVPAHDGDDPTEDAFSLLKNLWERSFIESNGQFGSDVCYLLNFKVHDVMRDLAFYVLEKDSGTPPAKQLYFYRAGHNLDEVPKDCTALSEALRLSFDTNKLKTLSDCFHAPKLVSLLLGGNSIVSLPENFSTNFPNLSVLSLRDGRFRRLPEQLGNLKNLVCLDLTRCSGLEILPATVRKLHKLKYLILDWCWNLRELPSGVSDLTSLQVLHIDSPDFIWDELTPIWHESMRRAQSSGHTYPALRASLENIYQLVHLTELTISTRHREIITYNVKLDSQLNTVHAPLYSMPAINETLQAVEISNNMSALTKLKILQLKLNYSSLPVQMAYRFIQLQRLHLYSYVLKYLPESFTSCGAFPALIDLTLCFTELVTFPEVYVGGLPKLQTLNLASCSALNYLPLSLQNLTSLKRLIVEGCSPYLQNSCSENCERSATWSKWHIAYNDGQVHTAKKSEVRRYTFKPYHMFW